jgi:hypothetical protein
MQNVEKTTELELATVLKGTKETPLTSNEVVVENVNQTMTAQSTLLAFETSVSILALELVALMRFVKSQTTFHFVLVQLDTLEIHSSLVEKFL